MVQNISNIRTSNYVSVRLVPEKALITARIEQNMKIYSIQICTIPCDNHHLLSLPGAVPPAGRGGRGQALQLGGGGGGLAGPAAATG